MNIYTLLLLIFLSNKIDLKYINKPQEVKQNSQIQHVESRNSNPMSKINTSLELKHDEIVIIGDSRTVAYQLIKDEEELKKDNVKIFAESGQGVNFLFKNIDYISKIRNKIVVFNIGINDIKLIEKYKEFYNSLKEEFYKNNDVYILSLNPVDENIKIYNIRNFEIKEFNELIKQYCKKNKIKFIDTYENIIKDVVGNTQDGLHYKDDLYEKIYSKIISLKNDCVANPISNQHKTKI